MRMDNAQRPAWIKAWEMCQLPPNNLANEFSLQSIDESTTEITMKNHLFNFMFMKNTSPGDIVVQTANRAETVVMEQLIDLNKSADLGDCPCCWCDLPPR